MHHNAVQGGEERWRASEHSNEKHKMTDKIDERTTTNKAKKSSDK